MDNVNLPLQYGSALLLVLLAFLVLVKGRRDGSVGLALGFVMLALIQVFDFFALQDPDALFAYKRAVVFLKSLMPVSFLSYGFSCRKRGSAAFSRLPFLVLAFIGTAFALSALVLPLESLFAPEESPGGRMIALGDVGYWFYLGLMIYCIAALVNLEAVFASLHGADRWRVKQEFLGVGIILGVFIFVLSQGLLYRSVNMALLPVRSAVLIVAALLIGHSRLFRGQSHKVVVSRHVFYRSFTLLAVGVYLLGLGLMGEFMKSFQVSVGRNLLLLAVFVSGGAFLALVFSEEVRRRVKVIVAKHFYAQKHDYREQWLGLSNALAASRRLDEVQEAIIEAYLRIFGLRFAALYVRAGGGESFALVAVQGREDLPRHFPLSPGLAGYFVGTGPGDEPARRGVHADGRRGGFLPGRRGLAPGADDGGQPPGGRGPARRSDRDGTADLRGLRPDEDHRASGGAVAQQLPALRGAGRGAGTGGRGEGLLLRDPRLEESRVHLLPDDGQRRGAHRRARFPAGPDRVDPRDGCEDERPDRQAEGLSAEAGAEDRGGRSRAAGAGDAGGRSEIEAGDCVRGGLRARRGAGRRAGDEEGVLNLLLNAGDALGGRAGWCCGRAAATARSFLSVEDAGCGMSRSFVEHQLFRPFRTTKEKGLGIGLYQCKQIVEAHGGRIEVESREGKGTVFTVVIGAGDRWFGFIRIVGIFYDSGRNRAAVGVRDDEPNLLRM